MRLPAIRTNSGQFQSFLRRNFCSTKTQNKQEPTNKLKLSECQTTEETIFCAQNLHKRGEIVYSAFFSI